MRSEKLTRVHAGVPSCVVYTGVPSYVVYTGVLSCVVRGCTFLKMDVVADVDRNTDCTSVWQYLHATKVEPSSICLLV